MFPSAVWSCIGNLNVGKFKLAANCHQYILNRLIVGDNRYIRVSYYDLNEITKQVHAP